MRSDILRILITLVVIAAAAIPLYRANAYDINDIVEVRINDKTADLVCKSQTVLDGIKRIQDGYLKQLVKDTLNELKDLVTAYALELIVCNLTDFDKTINVGAFGIGGTITFKGPNCEKSLGGADVAAFKRQVLDRIKNDFIARCIADGARRKAELDVRQIILENGPDGGPAYVTSYIDDVYIKEDERGIRRFCAILANTDVCPYMRDEVYSYFSECPRSYFENPPDLTGLGARVDGGDSFVQRAQCTADTITPEALSYDFLGYGGFDGLNLLMEPQNNPDGFIAMAEEELATQRATAIRAAELELDGGFWSFYGDSSTSCLNPVDGKCNAKGPIRQPAGAVRDINAIPIQAEFDWINNSDQMNTLMGDVRARLASMILTIDEMPLEYDIEFDASTQDYEDIGAGLKPPEDIRLPTLPIPSGAGEPGDDLCTGGNPDCFCARSDPRFFAVRDLVAEATEAAIQQHPEHVTPEGCVGNECSVVPGDEVLFLNDICETTVGESIECHPNAGSSDEVVVTASYFSVSVDVITSNGRVRIPGQTVAACQPGVQ